MVPRTVVRLEAHSVPRFPAPGGSAVAVPVVHGIAWRSWARPVTTPPGAGERTSRRDGLLRFFAAGSGLGALSGPDGAGQLVGVERRAHERTAGAVLESQLERALTPAAKAIRVDEFGDRQ